MNSGWTIQDAAAALVSVIIAVGVVTIAILGRDMPPSLVGMGATAMTWLFMRSAQQSEQKHVEYMVNGGSKREE